MANSPAFQFYPADYLSDEKVILMTLEEEGAYWRLVSLCWHQGSIPADPDLLNRMVKNTPNQPSSLVRSCFVEMPNQPSRLIHKRLEIERQKQEAWRTKSAEAGRKSGKSRRAKKLHAEPTFANGSGLVEPNANQMRTKPEPNTNSSSLSSNKENTKEIFTLPDWIPEQKWNDYEEMRRQIRKPMSTKAKIMAVGKLEKLKAKGVSVVDVLDNAVFNSYQGLFPPSGNGYHPQPNRKIQSQ